MEPTPETSQSARHTLQVAFDQAPGFHQAGELPAPKLAWDLTIDIAIPILSHERLDISLLATQRWVSAFESIAG